MNKTIIMETIKGKKVLHIKGKSETIEIYAEMFKDTSIAVLINLYASIGTLKNVVVVHGGNEILRQDNSKKFEEVEKEIKKQMIKNKLFFTGMTVEEDTLFLHTTDDIWSVMFAYDDASEIELAEIKQELGEEASSQCWG